MFHWRRGLVAASACGLPFVQKKQPCWCVEAPKQSGSAQPKAADSRNAIVGRPAAATPEALAPTWSRRAPRRLLVPPVPASWSNPPEAATNRGCDTSAQSTPGSDACVSHKHDVPASCSHLPETATDQVCETSTQSTPGTDALLSRRHHGETRYGAATNKYRPLHEYRSLTESRYF